MRPNAGGGESGGCGVSANEHSCTHGAQINFVDLPPYFLVFSEAGQEGYQDKSSSLWPLLGEGEGGWVYRIKTEPRMYRYYIKSVLQLSLGV